jgi:serine phosphatase RsbU (regulator of sigma subunit)
VPAAICTPAFTPSVQSWTVVRAAHARGERCGDVARVLPLDAARTAIVVVDVAGHGAARAPLSSAISDVIVTALLRGASPAEALGCVDGLLRACADDVPYAVAFAAVVNALMRTVVYASAGHDVAFTLDDGGHRRHLGATAPMLGIPIRCHPCDAAFVLEPTESLVIVTDGVSDSRRAQSDDFFGVDRTARAVERSLRAGSDPACSVLDAACTFAGGRQADDIAVVVARVGAPPRPHN